MKTITRRDMLKSTLTVPAALVAAEGMQSAEAVAQNTSTQSAPQTSVAVSGPGAKGPRERLLLDNGWRFHFGNANDSARDFGFGGGQGGNFQKTGSFLAPVSGSTYDDGEWQSVELPHDWVIGLPFKNDPALSSKGFYPLGRNYPETSVGWYRRVFELPSEDSGKRISLEFDGAYRNSLVTLNGFYIGQHAGGYDPFGFDVTDFAKFGAPNVLLVRVDATLSDGWFYEGAGIYRHVWLVKTTPVRVKKWGTFVRSTVQSGKADLAIRTEVENHDSNAKNVRVISAIVDSSGKTIAKAASVPAAVEGAGERTFSQQVTVARPFLWSLEERNLYTLVTEVEVAGAVVDSCETRFGIRSLKFDPALGFFLNGKSVKIKGTCNHQDHAGLGVALPDAAQYHRVRRLQDMGCNAYRTSHNPPTPALLDACDELGMLVLDETRMMSSNDEALAQFRDLVRRDRNHPSVFMWSMANEERESITDVGLRVLTAMKRVAEQEDGSRPATAAPPPLGAGLGQGGLTVCDVEGYNYADPQIEAFHKSNPNIPTMGTENVSAVATRGIYKTDPQLGFVSSYDPYTNTGRASVEGWWRFCATRPWLAGGFVWTGFDYRGEPSPYQWPNISSQYGIMDTCGFPKDSFFYLKAWWGSEPVLHVMPHWNWPGLEGQEIAVWVHTNLDKVELFLNGESLGAKNVAEHSHAAWVVKYAPGTLEARGFKGGQQVLTAKRETSGAAAKLVARSDRSQIAANGEDLAFVTVEVQDAAGRVVPITDNEITFAVSGAGKLLGVGNGDPTDHESDMGSVRKAFSGMCLAIAQVGRTAGDITMQASSPGLSPAVVKITATQAAARPSVSEWTRAVPQGPGVTGLWRPVSAAAPTGPDILQSNVGGDTIYTLVQHGNTITGTLEAPAAGFGPATTGGGAIEDGRVDGSSISFRVGQATYTGTVNGDQIELRRGTAARAGNAPPSPPAQPQSATQPAIGPPPDGSDPSFGAGGGGRGRGPGQAAILLRRVQR